MSIIIFLIIILSLFIYMYIKGKGLRVTEEEILLPEKIEERKLLFISDLHRRKLKVEDVQALPSLDLIIIGGDLAEKGMNESIVENNLTILSQLGKLYFVWGNNDYEFGKERLEKKLNQFRVTILENSAEVFSDYTAKWSVVGVGDYGTDHANVQKALQDALGPILFISHNPAITEELKDKERIIAVLSGHTHGGQVRIGPFGIAESGGWKKKHGIPTFISNGFGTRSLPFRLGTDPQMHVITLIGDKQHN